ncbi:MAG: RNA polymerase sigma factor FliA [Gammaproteobacteria bacterium]|nr:RNA polymerase sigma factor FliA [Gammaproteobacteria bacterium]
MFTGCAMYAEAQKDQRDQRIVDNIGLVKRIAYHLISRLPSSVQVDDMVQAGMVGLIEAAKHYDPTQGASFETYAGIRVRGAMLDEVRHGDWSPRSLHRKMRELNQAIREIENATGRDAKDHEVADKLGISLDEFHRIMRDSASARLFSLEQADDEGHPISLSTGEKEPFAALQKEGFQQALAKCISELPEREQMVMSLYYNEELNLKEIGQVLDISESRVCQIHGQALARVRSKLSDWTKPES